MGRLRRWGVPLVLAVCAARAWAALPQVTFRPAAHAIRKGVALRCGPSVARTAESGQGDNDRPLDASAVSILASAARRRNQLHLTAAFDIAPLGIEMRQGLWTGSAESVARVTASGGSVAGAAMLRSGLSWLGGPASGTLGALTIPLSQVQEERPDA